MQTVVRIILFLILNAECWTLMA